MTRRERIEARIELRTYYRVWASLADPYPMPAESFDPEPAAAYLDSLPAAVSRPAGKAPAVNWKARALAAELELAALKQKGGAAAAA